MRRFAFAVVGLGGIGSLVAGCILFTGSTNGYTLVDAGEDAGGACASAADCTDPDAGVCCFGISSAGIGAVCQHSCQGGVQFCSTDTECGGSQCITQKCAGFTFQACGMPYPPEWCSILSDAGNAGMDAAPDGD